MNSKLSFVFLLAIANICYSQHVHEVVNAQPSKVTTKVTGLEGAVGKAEGSVLKILDQINTAFDTVKKNTLGNSENLKNQYIKNFATIKAQFENAKSKLLTSYETNYNNVKTNLDNNYNNIKNQMQKAFDLGLTNFKGAFTAILAKAPQYTSVVDDGVENLQKKGKESFANLDLLYNNVKDELKVEYEDGVGKLNQ